MELAALLRSLPGPPLRISDAERRVLQKRRSFISSGEPAGNFPSKRSSSYANGRRERFFLIRPRFYEASPRCSTPAAPEIADDTRAKSKDLVFVAGSTGKVGSRTVRELLKLGFDVRAGVRSSWRAEALVQSVREMKVPDSGGSAANAQPVERLQVIECDLEDQEGIERAIGNASTVICCIGASEKEIFDVTGPYRIDYMATKNLIEAATKAKVDHFILLTSLGTNKVGFPAAILNLFWGVLVWKRKAEEALIASGLPYTIVRPGGMERPTDSYKETHNVVLADEDTYFGGLVSNLQVAELIADMARNRKLSYCKIVEVIAETTAPRLSNPELLERLPSKRELPDNWNTDDEQKKQMIEMPKAALILSPYAMYDELKPPSSPTPAAPSTSAGTGPLGELSPSSISKNKSKPLSPYTAYDALKPPSSPSPSIPAAATLPRTHEEEIRKQPLSPYTMYQDMRPPSSPTP